MAITQPQPAPTTLLSIVETRWEQLFQLRGVWYLSLLRLDQHYRDYIPPAPGGSAFCSAVYTAMGVVTHYCGREQGHASVHVEYNGNAEMVAVWLDTPASSPAPTPAEQYWLDHLAKFTTTQTWTTNITAQTHPGWISPGQKGNWCTYGIAVHAGVYYCTRETKHNYVHVSHQPGPNPVMLAIKSCTPPPQVALAAPPTRNECRCPTVELLSYGHLAGCGWRKA